MRSCLVVDDSPTVRLFLKTSLRALVGGSVTFREAADAGAARAELAAEAVDVVFLDINLGAGPHGIELMRGILATSPATTVVIITGLPEDDPQVVEALSLGAFACLRKPLRSADIRRVLGEMEEEAGRMGRIR